MNRYPDHRHDRDVTSRLLALSLLAILVLAPIGLGGDPFGNEGPDDRRTNAEQVPPSPCVDTISKDISDIDGFFEENRGQLENEEVLYYVKGDPLTIGLTRDGMVLVLTEEAQDDLNVRERWVPRPRDRWAVRVRFEGCNDATPFATKRSGTSTSYFIGDEASKWIADAPTFTEVHYPSLYDGVSLRVYFQDGMLKYDLVVEPGADPSQLAMSYEGAQGLWVDPSTGDLVIRTPLGELKDSRPVLFGSLEGSGDAVEGDFVLLEPEMVGFNIPPCLDTSHGFVIDPGLMYSTFIGGTAGERTTDVDLDDEGNIYITGGTMSSDFPTDMGAYQLDLVDTFDILVAKFDPTLSNLLSCTLIGGNEGGQVEEARNLEVVSGDGIYVWGYTMADDFPTTPDAVMGEYNGDYDCVVVKLSLDCSDLLYSSYIGGSGFEQGASIRVDRNDGCVYVNGLTTSTDFPTTSGAYCQTRGPELQSDDKMFFFVKINGSLDSIDACTYVAQSDYYPCEWTTDMVIAADGTIYMGTSTTNPDFPTTPNVYCSTYNGGYDGVIVRMSHELDRLLACTFVGTPGADWIVAIEVGREMNVYVGGSSADSGWPTTANAHDRTCNGYNSAIAVLDEDLTTVKYGTYFGGSGGQSEIHTMALNDDETLLYFFGWTRDGTSPTTVGCYDPVFEGGPEDEMMGAINLTTGALEYSTYLGTDGREEAYMCDIVLTDKGEVVMTGLTQSEDYPVTSGAYQTTMKSSLPELWVSIIDPRPIPPPPAPTLTAEPDDRKVTLTYELDAEWCIIDKYKLYRGENPDRMTLNRTIRDPERFVDRGLTNGVTYYYRISAFNSMGEGEWSDVVSAMPLGSPSAPTLEAWSGDGSVHLNWTPPARTGGGEILGYRVYSSLTPREEDFRHLVDLGNVTGWVHEDVDLGTEYYYMILAFNHRTDGRVSSKVLVMATDLPTEPKWLEVTMGDGTIEVRWGTPNSTGGVTLLGYRLYRGGSPDDMEMLVHTLPAEREYTDEDVENGRRYYYHVRAYSSVGEGEATHSGSILLLGRPSLPLNVVVTPEDEKIVITWDEPENDGGVPVTSYVIYAGRTVDGMIMMGTVPASSMEFLHEGLVNGQEWLYKVNAVNQYGDGPFSNIVSGTPYGVPDAPTGVVASLVEGQVHIIWLTPTDTGGAALVQYRLYRGTNPTSVSLIAYLGVEETQYTDVTAENGVTYHYAVTALSDVGESALSDTVSATPFGVASAPQNLTARLQEGAILLAWQPPTSDGGHPLMGYKVFRGISPDEQVLAAKLSTVYTYKDEDVDLGTTYHYSIVVYNQAGDSAPVTISKTYLSAPGEPLGLSVTVSDGVVTLNWNAPADDGGLPITGYLVMRGYERSTVGELKAVGLVTSYTDSSVVDGEAFWYSVVAVNGLGSGELPEPQYVKLPRDAPTEGKEEQSMWYLGVIGALIVMVIIGLGMVMLRRRPPADEEVVTKEAEAAPWHSGVAVPTRPKELEEKEDEAGEDETGEDDPAYEDPDEVEDEMA